MMLFDTHSHLNAEQFEEDLQEVIARMKEAGGYLYSCCWF